MPFSKLTELIQISTHTLRGERDDITQEVSGGNDISTHTLRGERDQEQTIQHLKPKISTHTLRGERDWNNSAGYIHSRYFNSHAPWGA